MAGVIDRDLGYKRTLQALAKLSNKGQIPRVLVGVRATAGADLVKIATINEFGSADGAHPPERSFLRSTMDENRTRYADLLQRALERTLDGADLEQQLGLVGAQGVADVQAKIIAFDDPGNAESTIAAKGFDNPLVETGRLGQSIDWVVEGVSK